MRFKIRNELQTTDYKRLTEFLTDNPSVWIELFPGADLDLVSVSPVVITVGSLGYKVMTQISFEQPIGIEVSNDLRLDDEMRYGLEVNRRNFKLARTILETADLENELNLILRTVECIVNHICNRFGRLLEQTFIINSEWLDKQLEMALKKEELKSRGEAAKPFGTIHAKCSKDAKERAGNLVPIYMERDKTYLYDDKKVFMLLPRDFVMKLLKIQGPTMMPADQFTDDEKETLRRFSTRQYVKTRKVGGKIYYCDLDETTRKLLLKGMQKKFSP